jgi:hypothetical protein
MTAVVQVSPAASLNLLRHKGFGEASLAQPVVLEDTGELSFIAPAEAYAGIAAWHSASAWLGALKLHPNLAAECRGIIKVPLFLAIMRVLAGYADHHNGRGIAVAHATVAKLVEHCPKTVQRACEIAVRLGALRLVLRGCDMSINQRGAVLQHYRDRTNPRRRWRSLPNFYAATMPASLAALAPRRGPATKPSPHGPLASTVENPHPLQLAVHQPVGVQLSGKCPVPLFERTTFSPTCGQPAPRPREQRMRTGAARPTTPQQQERGSGRRRLDPDAEAYARALRALLPGFQRVSLYRISNALGRYRTTGLSPTDLVGGLNTYLAAAGLAWYLDWAPEHGAEQARYLIGMLTKARQGGYLIPGP